MLLIVGIVRLPADNVESARPIMKRMVEARSIAILLQHILRSGEPLGRACASAIGI